MRLLAVELTRLRWRRAVVLLLLACLAFPAIVAGAVAWDTRPYSAAEVAEAEEQAAEAAQEPWVAEELAECRAAPGSYGIEVGPGSTEDPEAACAEAIVPVADHYLWRNTLDIHDQINDSYSAVVVVIAALLILLGATFVGTDWNTGSMSNQLLFEPRRGRIWAAKAGAVALTGLLVAAVVSVGFWLALWAIAESRDLSTDAQTIREVVAASGRGTVFVAAAGLAGYGLTMLFRSTVATLGVIVAVLLLGTLVVTLLPFAGTGQWVLTNNVLAFLLDGTTYYDGSLSDQCTDPDFMEPGCDGLAELGLGQASAYLSVLLALAVVPSWFSFRRKDIA